MAKIYINPGHGGQDSGAIGVNGRKEKDDVLKYAKDVAEKLKAAGHTVKLERSDDSYINVTDIAKKANYWGADYFIAFHRNAFNGTAHGAECLVCPSCSDMSKKLAQAIIDALVSVGFDNRGVKIQSKNVHVLTHTTMPATTIECGFVDNAEDNAIFDSKYASIVDRTANAIISVIGENKASEVVVSQPAAPAENVPKLNRVLKMTSPLMTGDDVKQAQDRLVRHNAYFSKCDGIFGKKTKAAVMAFQNARIKEGRDVGCRYNGNKADGKIGQLTWAILWE